MEVKRQRGEGGSGGAPQAARRAARGTGRSADPVEPKTDQGRAAITALIMTLVASRSDEQLGMQIIRRTSYAVSGCAMVYITWLNFLRK